MIVKFGCFIFSIIILLSHRNCACRKVWIIFQAKIQMHFFGTIRTILKISLFQSSQSITYKLGTTIQTTKNHTPHFSNCTTPTSELLSAYPCSTFESILANIYQSIH